jgi:hypothetical protein
LLTGLRKLLATTAAPGAALIFKLCQRITAVPTFDDEIAISWQIELFSNGSNGIYASRRSARPLTQ